MLARRQNWVKLLRWGVGVAVVAVLTPSTLAGCRFFNLGNPLLPPARLVAVPKPSMVKVNYTYQLADNNLTVEFEDPEVEISAYPNDATPGTFIHSYSAEYFDQSGRSISTLELTKVSFGVAGYVPPASGGSGSVTPISMQLPIYNQQVQVFGQKQVFSRLGGIALADQLIHTINCRVTLIGEDDNYNQVEIPLNVPIRFSGSIAQ